MNASWRATNAIVKPNCLGSSPNYAEIDGWYCPYKKANEPSKNSKGNLFVNKNNII
jgi:hypothetical protein